MMAGSHPTRWSDQEILTMLDLRDNEGMSVADIARRFKVTRNTVLGIMHRVKRDEKPGAEKHHGTMPRRWWLR